MSRARHRLLDYDVATYDRENDVVAGAGGRRPSDHAEASAMHWMARVVPILLYVLAATVSEGQVRLSEPRIEPLAGGREQWSVDVQDGMDAFGVELGPSTNLVRTLARHPDALKGVGPLAAYVRREAMVPAVDQVLLALRVAWLCHSEAVWAEQATEARGLGLSDADLKRIAEGADAGWGGWDATVIRAADELYRESFLSDASWDAMAERYNPEQLIDVIFTTAEYIMLSMLANSLGVQPDERFPDRLPADVARVIGPTAPTPVQLSSARLAPVPMSAWTEEQRQLLDPTGTGQPTLNLFMTLAQHPKLYRPRGAQSRYIRTASTLPGRVREMLILRVGWLCGAEYEWAQHAPIGRDEGLTSTEVDRIAGGPNASGWSSSDAALLAATDELYHDDMVSDDTWNALAGAYSDRQLIDIVITVAGYRMVSMALNSLGVQIEPGKEGFPQGVQRRPNR